MCVCVHACVRVCVIHIAATCCNMHIIIALLIVSIFQACIYKHLDLLHVVNVLQYLLFIWLQVYIAECVGVHIVGYIFIVYGGAGAVGSICVSKVIGWISITSVALLTMCLNVGIVAFLLIWKREPSYYVIFVIAILWGICDGSWSIVNSSKY